MRPPALGCSAPIRSEFALPRKDAPFGASGPPLSASLCCATLVDMENISTIEMQG
jgi:hypothetical protein